jgi:hypothetical protein
MEMLRLTVNKLECAVLRVCWKSVHACPLYAHTATFCLEITPPRLVMHEILLSEKLLLCNAMLVGRSGSLARAVPLLKSNASHPDSLTLHFHVKTSMIVKVILVDLTVFVWMASRTTVAIVQKDSKKQKSRVRESVATLMIATVFHAARWVSASIKSVPLLVSAALDTRMRLVQIRLALLKLVRFQPSGILSLLQLSQCVSARRR